MDVRLAVRPYLFSPPPIIVSLTIRPFPPYTDTPDLSITATSYEATHYI